jgi:hypothetical protein
LLHAIPLLWQVIISLVWFGIVEWPFHVWEASLDRAYLVALLIFLSVAFILYYIVIVNIGWYLALLPPSFVALTLRFVYQWHAGGSGKTPGDGTKVEIKLAASAKR